MNSAANRAAPRKCVAQDGGHHRHAGGSRASFFIPVKYWLTNHLQRIAICRCIWTLIVEGDTRLKQTDYVRMAEKCTRRSGPPCLPALRETNF